MTEHTHDDIPTTDGGQTPGSGVKLDLDAAEAWSIDDILDQIRTPETVARFTLRADLEAERVALLEELSRMVDPMGELILDEEDSLGSGKAARAKAHRLHQVDKELHDSRRSIRFRGLNSDQLFAFEAIHHPINGDKKTRAVDNVSYLQRLVVETAIAPKVTAEGLEKLRGRLGFAAYQHILVQAEAATYKGGVDLGKLPDWSQTLEQD